MAKYEALFDERTSHLSDEDYLVQKPLHAMEENMHLLKDLGYEDELLMTDETLENDGRARVIPARTRSR